MVEAHGGHIDQQRQNDWASVEYDARFDEYRVQAGSARQLLFYCPWCGEKLPPSQREHWFDELEARGIDPNIHPIPAELQGGKWRGAVPPDELARSVVDRRRHMLELVRSPLRRRVMSALGGKRTRLKSVDRGPNFSWQLVV